MATEGQKWPLFVDPQGLATKWIMSMEKSKSIIASSTNAPDFVRILTNALRAGTPLLVEITNYTIDLFLDPILMKQTFEQDDVVSVSCFHKLWKNSFIVKDMRW